MGSNSGQPHSNHGDAAPGVAPNQRGRPQLHTEVPTDSDAEGLGQSVGGASLIGAGDAPDTAGHAIIPPAGGGDQFAPQHWDATFALHLLRSPWQPGPPLTARQARHQRKLIASISKAQKRTPWPEVIHAVTPLGSVFIATVGLVVAAAVTPFGWQSVVNATLVAVASGTVTFYARHILRGRRQRGVDAGESPADGNEPAASSRRREDSRDIAG